MDGPIQDFLAVTLIGPMYVYLTSLGKEIFDISRVCVCVSACVCMHVFMYVCIKV